MLSMEWISSKELAELLFLPACILAVALIIGVTLNKIINRRITQHLNIEDGSWQYVFINAVRGAPISFSLVTGLYWIVNTANIPEGLSRIFSYVLFTVIIMTITRVIARTLTGVIARQMERSRERLPKTTLIDAILNTIVYAMGILVVLQYYGISIAPILTAMGVGGMAVALALQEPLSNVFAGLHLILSKQLKIGDYIRLSSTEEGRVMDITWRFTSILPSGKDNMVIIPNSKIAAAVIHNFSLPMNNIAIPIPLGVAYDSDLEEVERITIEVAEEVMRRIDEHVTIAPAVRFQGFGESSIDFKVILHSSNFDNQFIIKHEFIKALTKRYREEGIDIPYPIRTNIIQKEY